MRRKIIKKLAEESYLNGNLDKKKVSRIEKLLKKQYLKAYIKDLKTIEAKKTVKITVPDETGLNEKRRIFSKIYPGKRIVFSLDPGLLTGIRVEEFDNLYELSLRNVLGNSIKEATND